MPRSRHGVNDTALDPQAKLAKDIIIHIKRARNDDVSS